MRGEGLLLRSGWQPDLALKDCNAAVAVCGGSAIELRWRPFAVIQSALNSEVRCLVSEPLLPFACRHGTAPLACTRAR